MLWGPKPAEWELVRWHLQKYLGNLLCPVCGNKEWNVGGPIREHNYAESAPLPVVVTICTECFFVRHFAWEPMVEAAKKARP